MQFDKVLITSTFLFIECCMQSALTARLHYKGRSALLQILPLRPTDAQTHGRSLATESVLDTVLLNNNSEESRGLIQKFTLFKSLFQKQKPEPANNIIIITQPQTTHTTPTTAGTTTTTTAAADSPTRTNLLNGREDSNLAALDENNNLAPLLDGAIEDLENSQAQAIVQKLIKQTKTEKRKRFNKFSKFDNKKQNQKKVKRKLRQRHTQLKRLTPAKTQPLGQKQQLNKVSVENILNNMNLTKRPNRYAENNNDNDSNKNNNHNNNASGILNFNTNMRLQNIMNAFRKQTPIIYNY